MAPGSRYRDRYRARARREGNAGSRLAGLVEGQGDQTHSGFLTMVREINAELLLGRQVIAPNGKSIGRIEEIIAEPQGSQLIVTEFHLGSFGLMERFAMSL